jgi:hypothetical protein
MRGRNAPSTTSGNSPQSQHQHISALSSSFRRFGGSSGSAGAVVGPSASSNGVANVLSLDAVLTQTVAWAQKAALGCAAFAVLIACAGGACVAGAVAGATGVALVRTWALWGDLPTNAAVPVRLDFTSEATHHRVDSAASAAAVVGPLGVGWIPIGTEERADKESEIFGEALVAAACYCAFPSPQPQAAVHTHTDAAKETSSTIRNSACRYASSGGSHYATASSQAAAVPPEPFGPISLPTSHELPAFTLAPNSVYDVELDLTLPDLRALYPTGTAAEAVRLPRVGGMVTARIDVIGLAHPSDCEALTPNSQSASSWWPLWGAGDGSAATSESAPHWSPPPATAAPVPIVLASAATSTAVIADQDEGVVGASLLLIRNLLRLPFQLLLTPAPIELEGRTVRLSLLHRFAPTAQLMKRARYLRVTVLPPAAAQQQPQPGQMQPPPFAVLGTPTLHVRGETRSTAIWLLQRHPYLTAVAIFVPIFVGTTVLGVMVLAAVLLFVVSSFMSR